MTPRRLLHLGLVVLCLAAFGVTLWSVARRMGVAAERAGSPSAAAGTDPSPRLLARQSEAFRRASGSTTPVIQEPPERRTQRAALVSAQQELARAQEYALEGVAEEDQPVALARFQEANRRSIADAEAARDDLLKPSDPMDVGSAIPGTEAARKRFAAVRRAVIDDGLPLESAEARAEARPPSHDASSRP